MTLECRICKDNHNESTNPLISPCSCTGSIGLVHNDCLQRWIETSNTDKCSMCNTTYAQKINYSGPLPQSFVEYFVKREKILSSIIGILSTTVFFVGGPLTSFGIWWWSYFITSKLTFIKVSLFYCWSYAMFVLFGAAMALGRQINLSVNGIQLRMNIEDLFIPLCNVTTFIEFTVASYHTTFTGWTPAVTMMYYLALYNLLTCLLFDDLAGWYKKHYYKKIFINNPDNPTTLLHNNATSTDEEFMQDLSEITA